MSARTNLVLQSSVVAVVAVVRLAQPGWLLIIFVMSLVGPVLLIHHIGVTRTAVRRERLPERLATPFVLAAAGLLVGNLLLADYTDGSRYASPLELVTGPLPDDLQAAGELMLVGWVLCLVWVTIELHRTERRTSD